MIPAEYILIIKLGKHYLIDSYENNHQKDNSIKKMSVLIGKKGKNTLQLQKHVQSICRKSLLF